MLGLVSSAVAIFEAASEIYDATHGTTGLPKKFRTAADDIPLIVYSLGLAEESLRAGGVSDEAIKAAKFHPQPLSMRVGAYYMHSGPALDVSFPKSLNHESSQDGLPPPRVPYTCNRLLSQPQYRQRLDSHQDNSLWLSADPGYGTSVLSIAVVDG